VVNEKKWFSWGWLIFWIIVCLPIAIIYLLIKLGDRDKPQEKRIASKEPINAWLLILGAIVATVIISLSILLVIRLFR
jgi:heme/copper-type cytochrome/quinol oxidase subunit 2